MTKTKLKPVTPGELLREELLVPMASRSIVWPRRSACRRRAGRRPHASSPSGLSSV